MGRHHHYTTHDTTLTIDMEQYHNDIRVTAPTSRGHTDVTYNIYYNTKIQKIPIFTQHSSDRHHDQRHLSISQYISDDQRPHHDRRQDYGHHMLTVGHPQSLRRSTHRFPPLRHIPTYADTSLDTAYKAHQHHHSIWLLTSKLRHNHYRFTRHPRRRRARLRADTPCCRPTTPQHMAAHRQTTTDSPGSDETFTAIQPNPQTHSHVRPNTPLHPHSEMGGGIQPRPIGQD